MTAQTLRDEAGCMGTSARAVLDLATLMLDEQLMEDTRRTVVSALYGARALLDMERDLLAKAEQAEH